MPKAGSAGVHRFRCTFSGAVGAFPEAEKVLREADMPERLIANTDVKKFCRFLEIRKEMPGGLNGRRRFHGSFLQLFPVKNAVAKADFDKGLLFTEFFQGTQKMPVAGVEDFCTVIEFKGK